VDSQLATIDSETPSQEERNWGIAAHLAALIAFIGFPFGHVIGPLIVYLAKGKEFPFVAAHARASINYQITLSLVLIVGVMAAVVIAATFAVTIGISQSHASGDSNAFPVGIVVVWVGFILAAIACSIASLVFIIMGAIAAGAGKPYKYPFAIEFLR
jgi:uncharacterized protein